MANDSIISPQNYSDTYTPTPKPSEQTIVIQTVTSFSIYGQPSNKHLDPLENFIKFLEIATVQIAIILFSTVIFLAFTSFWLHRKNNDKKKEHRSEYLMLQTLTYKDSLSSSRGHNYNKKKPPNTTVAESDMTNINMNLNNSGGFGDDDNNISREASSVSLDSFGIYNYSNNNNNNNNIDQLPGGGINRFVNYVSGFGKNANHFAIFLIGLGIFDVYTDIAYLFDLFYSEYYLLFSTFIGSMCLAIIFNVAAIIYFIKNEFKRNQLFTNWFYEYNGIIMIFVVLFTLTDANLIATVFTSQIFGHSAFYSPMSIISINIIQMSNVVSICIEHIPQLIVQLIAITGNAYNSKDDDDDNEFNSIVVAALVVSGIDIFFLTVKAIVWVALHVQTRNKIKMRT